MHIPTNKSNICTYVILCSYIVATSGEEGRKALMREIELGKLLGENPQPNIVKFIGCVTTQGKSCYCGNCFMYDLR